MKSVYKTQENCCGCMACFNVCSKNAITIHISEEGYSYPAINSELCINCGLCQKTCQFNKTIIEDAYKTVQCFALKHKDFSVICASRSAGAFTAFSDYILDNSGIVYGAKLDADFVVRHHRATNKEERDSFRESKYVQSELFGVFKSVEEDLKEGKNVLFTGTGCQCDGLRAFLNTKKISTEKLILADIVCHGVPSPKMFIEYLHWNEKKYHSAVKNFKFRDKQKYSWGEGIEKLTLANGKVKYQDYFTGSLFDFFIRPSCYNCKYTTPYRNSDITFADFWGSEKSAPEFTDYKNGCSLVLLHSDKAEKIFDSIKGSVLYKEVSVEDCLQPRLKSPREKEAFIDSYWNEYLEYGFDHIMRKYAENTVSAKKRFKKFIHRAGGKILRTLKLRK
ncbi:MAG: Coenzyme F420 hydrogenase/dehydrogenase, beta subunit C-terminal domain [Treponema sp.]|nr:Coenzyme F420 hydrogenase/dehydrogenase, beta subunit C-terminal domain [Treponema sp.]